MWGDTADWVNRKTEEQKALRLWANDVADTLKAQKVSDMPKGGTAPDMADLVSELERRMQIANDAEKSVNDAIEERIRLKEAVDDVVDNKLKPIEQKILSMRYQQQRLWQSIALRLGYDLSSVKRIEGRAVWRIGHYMEKYNVSEKDKTK